MITIENDWLKVSIKTEGAEVREVHHKKNELDYMWTGDSAYWGRVSPVLFPIVGRLKGDQYVVDGQSYSMSQHGFLRDVNFEIAEQTASSATFQFASASLFTDIYPYEFKAVIHYTLNEASLSVRWEITNENKETMYFSIGAHPAFQIPLFENETVEDYKVKVIPAANKKAMEYELTNSLIKEKGPADGVQSFTLTPSLFANDASIYSNIDYIALESTTTSNGIDVMLKGFPFVGIWSKYNETDGTIAPFICIEPWYGVADTHETSGELKDKIGINKLEAGEIFQAEYGMRFR